VSRDANEEGVNDNGENIDEEDATTNVFEKM